MTYHNVGSYYRPPRLRARRRTWRERLSGWFERHPWVADAVIVVVLCVAMFCAIWWLMSSVNP